MQKAAAVGVVLVGVVVVAGVVLVGVVVVAGVVLLGVVVVVGVVLVGVVVVVGVVLVGKKVGLGIVFDVGVVLGVGRLVSWAVGEPRAPGERQLDLPNWKGRLKSWQME